MFLRQLLERLPILNHNRKRKSTVKHKKVRPKFDKDEASRSNLTTAILEASKQSSTPTNKGINSSRQLNEEIDKIEKLIKTKGTNNSLLLKKGEILLLKGKYNQSRKILNEIIKSKTDRESSRAARELLLLSQQLQKNDLIENLQKAGRHYNQTLINLPKNLRSPSDLEITEWVRDEASKARSADLPKLSHELIDLTLNAGIESSSLLLEKALSLNMMGRKTEALDILKKLQKETKGWKITNTINKTIENIQKKSSKSLLKVNIYLAKQSKAVAKANSLETKFIPDLANVEANMKLKSLVYKEAMVCLSENTSAALSLINSILDYFPKDGASLQLKGEILCTLNRSNEALQIWKTLATSKDEEIAATARSSIATSLSKKAKQICSKTTPREAILFFIESSFKYNISTNIDERIMKILGQIKPPDDSFTDPELRKHEMQLQYNTLVIEYFEKKWRKQERLDAGIQAQKPGTIRKTDPKAG